MIKFISTDFGNDYRNLDNLTTRAHGAISRITALSVLIIAEGNFLWSKMIII